MKRGKRSEFILAPMAVGLAGGLVIALSCVIGNAQATKKPYDKETLLKVVKLNAYSTQELVSYVQQRGVDFQTTPDIAAEFRQAGARPELIETIRSSYKLSAPATPSSPPPSTSPTTPAKPTGGVPAGPPLSKDQIITMLQGGVPPARVEQFVEVRGVSFTLTPDISREITRAGGNRSLLGAISEKATSTTSAAPAATSAKATKTGPDYEELTDQAVSALQAKNSAQATRLLQQAISMDSSRPTAYQLLGYTELYLDRDILSANRSMRAAIERGGAAAFRVYHDHDGFFKTWCQGSFFVTKSRVTFKADDGNHTFEADDSAMKEVEVNGFVGSEVGAFHLKVFQDSAKNKTKNYNFAPATTKPAESSLIVTLIKAYQ